jgi:hypothetical protein
VTKNTREITFVKHIGNIKGGTLLIDACNRENVIMHVVHGVNTYRDVSVASSIFGGIRKECQAFDLTQFRNHIYKEQTRQKKEVYYIVNRRMDNV